MRLRPPSLLRDRRGLAGIEFALIGPAMVVFFLGTIEMANVYRVKAKLNTAVGQLAELVAGDQAVTAPGGSLADACAGGSMNMIPYSTNGFAADIASVTNDHPANRVLGSSDTTSVHAYLDWENVSSCPTTAPGSLGLSGAFQLANTPLSLLTKSGTPAASTTDASLQMGYSAIMVKANYTYHNVMTFMLGGSLTFTAIAVARPRTNVEIPCTDPSGTIPCPVFE